MVQASTNQALTMTAGILFLLSFILMLVASTWRLLVGLVAAIVVLLVVALALACASSCGGSPESPGLGWFPALLIAMVVFFALGAVLTSIVYLIGAIEALLWQRAPELHHRGLIIMGVLGIVFTALGFVATTIIPLVALSWFDYSIFLPIPPILASILLIIAGVLTKPKTVSNSALPDTAKMAT
jgi:hypothetical protein